MVEGELVRRTSGRENVSGKIAEVALRGPYDEIDLANRPRVCDGRGEDRTARILVRHIRERGDVDGIRGKSERRVREIPGRGVPYAKFDGVDSARRWSIRPGKQATCKCQRHVRHGARRWRHEGPRLERRQISRHRRERPDGQRDRIPDQGVLRGCGTQSPEEDRASGSEDLRVDVGCVEARRVPFRVPHVNRDGVQPRVRDREAPGLENPRCALPSREPIRDPLRVPFLRRQTGLDQERHGIAGHQAEEHEHQDEDDDDRDDRLGRALD